MGNCSSNCFSSLTSFSKLKTLFERKSKREDFTYLIDDDESLAVKPPKRHFLQRIIDQYRKPQTMKGSITSILNNQLPLYYNRLFEIESSSSAQNQNDNNIQLQCLDAKALLSKQTNLTQDNSSVSSLDLEWEHEYPNDSPEITTNFKHIKPNDQRLSPNSNNVSCSSSSAASPHLSCHSVASNSLEWWVDSLVVPEAEQFDHIDIDTENLLNEIDRLTKKALNETGMEL